MLEYLKIQEPDMYDEVIGMNVYQVLPEEIQGKVVYDLGGNKGFFALMCNEFGAKEIICVEPQAKIYPLLYQNTQHISTIKRFNFAVTNKSMDVVQLSDQASGSSLYTNLEKGVDKSVTTITLSDLVGKRPETDMVLKLDIEGAEYDVLLHSEPELLKKFKTIYMEIHENWHPKYKGSEILENRLYELGFNRVHHIDMWIMIPNPDGTIIYDHPLGYRVCKFIRNN